MPPAENVTLTLDPYPGSIDGHVGGVIGVPAGLAEGREFVIELLCVELELGGGRADGGNRDGPRWQDVRTFGGKPRADGGVDIAFCFDVPASAPYTSSRSTSSSDHVRWNLRVTSKQASEDFERHWRIPVLASGQRASGASSTNEPVVLAAEVDSQLNRKPGGGGLVMDHPAGRAAATAPLLLFGGLAFCGAGWLLARRGELFFGAVLCLIGMLAGAGAVWLLGNSLQVEVRSGSLHITRRLCGIPIRNTRLPLSRIAGIACTKGMMSERGPETRVYYRLLARTLDGDSHVIGDAFVGYSAAMDGARRLSALTGLKVLE
jgi:hypothetical protein